MSLFSLLGSKKTSEAGVWVADEEVTNCHCCNVAFSMVIRKHHCRQCGQVVCNSCSENRKYLESSRSGTQKRICDTCWAADNGTAAEGEDVDEAAKRLEKASLGAGGAGADEPKRPAPGMPAISTEEAARGLREHPFVGVWECKLTFATVDLGRGTPDAVSSGLTVGAIKKVDTRGGRKSVVAVDAGPVKVGSKLKVLLTLETKGAAYFKGTSGDFGQFGKDGKVTGALQRSAGKVTMTIQTISFKTTTSFNFTGMMNGSGIYMGSFSGCEIAKSAGNVSGTFKMMRLSDEEAVAAGGKKRGEVEDDMEDSDVDDGDAVAKAKPSPRRKSAAVVKKSAARDADEDEEEEAEEADEEAMGDRGGRGGRGGRPKPPSSSSKSSSKRKVADDDDDDTEEEAVAARPSKVKGKRPGASGKAGSKAPASDDDDSD